MNKIEKETIEEVIKTINFIYIIIKNNHKHNAKISQDLLEDMAEGLNTSLSKLNDLVK